MRLEIREVERKADLKAFIYLPEELHRDHPQWVPPIYSEEKKYFDHRKNPAFVYSDAVLYIAWEDGQPVGRIMGIINKKYNELRKERNARFGYLECPNDREIAQALLAAIEHWAGERGMEKLVGPLGFSDQDPEGFLIEGFEKTPSLATYCNREYLPHLLGANGYAKEVDYVVYKIDLSSGIPEFYERIFLRVTRKKEYAIGDFTKRKQLKPFILPIFRLMNDCFRDLYGYLPLDEEEMNDLARRYLPLLDPRFIKIILKGEEVVAFVIGIPNLAEGIRKAKGKLLPFGVFRILQASKKAQQLDLMLGGIKQEFRGLGLDAILGYRIMQDAIKGGFVFIDSHHELEFNVRMRAEMEKIGGRIYKRFRIFQKSLVQEADVRIKER